MEKSKNKKVIRLTEKDLTNIIKRVIQEQLNDSDQIKAIQDFLNARYKKDPKFIQLKVDGKTGPNSSTEKAIMKYQIEKGLESDGQIGPNTSSAMRKDGLDKFEKRYKLFGLF
jgi:peptidoglycan hydrolase-like protein with peptidoglycan-binding domain